VSQGKNNKGKEPIYTMRKEELNKMPHSSIFGYFIIAARARNKNKAGKHKGWAKQFFCSFFF
jgi:hypothetical protein